MSGTDDTYVALYTPPESPEPMADADRTGGLQHLGILVDDLDPIEVLVKAEGIEPYNHMTYEPGRRFYFNDDDGIEFEVVAYDV
ncbi:MAG: hypothetical protein P8J50_06840 [Acidimicrobiales bacterium]|jgi:catechol 2,3-dioxygenase-like lactoylglutathione lyase family enzyme|nr:hypothetical protein [Acidimicrobiales bacterium]